MMRRKLTIDRDAWGGWNVVQAVDGEVVAGPFETRAEAEQVWAELRDAVDWAEQRCA